MSWCNLLQHRLLHRRPRCPSCSAARGRAMRSPSPHSTAARRACNRCGGSCCQVRGHCGSCRGASNSGHGGNLVLLLPWSRSPSGTRRRTFHLRSDRRSGRPCRPRSRGGTRTRDNYPPFPRRTKSRFSRPTKNRKKCPRAGGDTRQNGSRPVFRLKLDRCS